MEIITDVHMHVEKFEPGDYECRVMLRKIDTEQPGLSWTRGVAVNITNPNHGLDDQFESFAVVLASAFGIKCCSPIYNLNICDTADKVNPIPDGTIIMNYDPSAIYGEGDDDEWKLSVDSI